MESVSQTISYYNEHADEFKNRTQNVSFNLIRERFCKYLKPKAKILDFGCGAGRDSKAFVDLGYQTEALDGSIEMVKIASDYAEIPVRHCLFKDFDELNKYDGIFACASILHVPYKEQRDLIQRMSKALYKQGVLYISYKYGENERQDGDRFFCDMNEKRFNSILKQIPALTLKDSWISNDVRKEERKQWLNVILQKD